MKDIIVSQAVSDLLPIILSVLGTLGTFVLGSFNTYIKTKTKNEKVAHALERITRTAGTVVSEIMQTMVIGLKEKASDGKLTQADKLFLKNEAIEVLMSRVSMATLQDAALGVNDVTGFVKSKIEEAVFKAKPVVSYMDIMKKYNESITLLPDSEVLTTNPSSL